MATLLWQRDIGADISGVKATYSSWDSCMTKAYCKWPAIVGIVIASLIILSLVWCITRCLCCGAECCCGCLSCCNACCPSPRRKQQGYQQPPPQPYQPYPTYSQYQSPQPPAFASGALGYRAQTATFDAPSNQQKNGRYNEDALPAMPSWDHATSRHVEDEEVEMEKLNHQQAQHQSLLPGQGGNAPYYGNGHQDAAHGGDLGSMTAARPYHDYQQHQQFAPSPYGSQRTSAYPPTYHSDSPVSPSGYSGAQGYGGGYQPSIPPSYHTRPESAMVSPISSPPPQKFVPRRPVQGSWREV